MRDFTRSFPLEDIRIRSGGDGRTVEAYAAVFGVDARISDKDGQYQERLHPASFDDTVAQRGTNFGVLYNHGMTIYGTPSDRGSMPIGTPLEAPRPDARGLFTVTRYNQTPLAEEALEGIKSGAIRAQSFQGRFIRSDKSTPRGGFRAASDGTLPTVTRMEIALKEYGPTPFPAYDDAVITGVRAALTFTPAEQAIFKTLLAETAAGDDIVDTIVPQAIAVLGLDSALDCVQMYLSALTGEPNPDEDDPMDGMIADPDRSAALRRLEAVSLRLRQVATGASAELATGSLLVPHRHLSLRALAREKGAL